MWSAFFARYVLQGCVLVARLIFLPPPFFPFSESYFFPKSRTILQVSENHANFEVACCGGRGVQGASKKLAGGQSPLVKKIFGF